MCPCQSPLPGSVVSTLSPSSRTHTSGIVDLASKNAHYRFSYRQLHVALLLLKANKLLLPWEKTLPDDISVVPRIMNLEDVRYMTSTFSTYPFHKRLEPVLDPADDRREPLGRMVNNAQDLERGEHYFDGRAQRLLRDFALEGGASKGVRIVEEIRAFGDKEVFTMIKVRRRESPSIEPFELVSSVTRIGCAFSPH